VRDCGASVNRNYARLQRKCNRSAAHICRLFVACKRKGVMGGRGFILESECAVVLDGGIEAASLHQNSQRVLFVDGHKLGGRGVCERNTHDIPRAHCKGCFCGITSLRKSSFDACRLTASRTPKSLPTLGMRGTTPQVLRVMRL